MSEGNYLKISIPTIIYSVVTIIYLLNLSKLNKHLIEHYSNQNAFSLLSYNDGQPWHYFFYAIGLVITGGFLLYYLGRLISRNEMFFKEVLLSLGACCVTGVFMVKILKDINIPIFQAVLAFLALSGVAAAIFFNSN